MIENLSLFNTHCQKNKLGLEIMKIVRRVDKVLPVHLGYVYKLSE